MNQQASHLNPVAMGKRLKLARKNKLLTQDELSEKVGITLNFYGMIERGEKAFPLIRSLIYAMFSAKALITSLPERSRPLTKRR